METKKSTQGSWVNKAILLKMRPGSTWGGGRPEQAPRAEVQAAGLQGCGLQGCPGFWPRGSSRAAGRDSRSPGCLACAVGDCAGPCCCPSGSGQTPRREGHRVKMVTVNTVVSVSVKRRREGGTWGHRKSGCGEMTSQSSGGPAPLLDNVAAAVISIPQLRIWKARRCLRLESQGGR